MIQMTKKYRKNKRAVQEISSLTLLTELEKFAKYPPTGLKSCLRRLSSIGQINGLLRLNFLTDAPN
jgi:hypothetical protein